jgi:succinate dehydrogenase flavin-adding protein (antitoxin of CptAB toxin-antitoxin module)
MKELDLLLQRWLAQCFDTASDTERTRFAALLELPDPELAHYLLAAGRPADPDLTAAVDAVLAAAASTLAAPGPPDAVPGRP